MTCAAATPRWRRLSTLTPKGRHLDYQWDGARVDLYRNTTSGEVFRVELGGS